MKSAFIDACTHIYTIPLTRLLYFYTLNTRNPRGLDKTIKVCYAEGAEAEASAKEEEMFRKLVEAVMGLARISGVFLKENTNPWKDEEFRGVIEVRLFWIVRYITFKVVRYSTLKEVEIYYVNEYNEKDVALYWLKEGNCCEKVKYSPYKNVHPLIKELVSKKVVQEG